MEHEKNMDYTQGTNKNTGNGCPNNGQNNTAGGSFIRKFNAGNYEITMNHKKLKSPVELLEKFSAVRNNESLTNEEKSKQVQEILKEYME